MNIKDIGGIYPEPLSLIKKLLKQSTCEGDIVLNFFVGSRTVGHAILALNAESDDERKFILVPTTEATESDLEKTYVATLTASD